MHAIGGVLLVALMFTFVSLGTQWLRTTEDLATARRTVEGYLTLIEGLYAYRADNVSVWPSSFSALTPYLPMLHIDAVDPTQAGANGEGSRYSLAIVGGSLTISTTVSTEQHARSVVREFGANGTYLAAADGYSITIAVPAPGGISLMQHTLLTDGTNKMQRPLWLEHTVSVGDQCSETGLALDGDGNLLRCHGGYWLNH